MGLLSSIGDAISGSLGGIFGSAAGAGVQGMFSSAQSKAQMAFQEKSYRNRYQWAVEDLVKAGLNPKLAVQQSQGSGLSGAMGSISQPDFVYGASTARRLKEEVGLLAEQRRTQSQIADKAEVDARRARRADSIESASYNALYGGPIRKRIMPWIDRFGGSALSVMKMATALEGAKLIGNRKPPVYNSTTNNRTINQWPNAAGGYNPPSQIWPGMEE